VLPAHQRLGADDAAGAQIDLWLVVQQQVPLGDGTAQLAFHFQPFEGARVHVDSVQVAAAAALGACLVHCRYGMAEQLVAVAAVLREKGNADADAKRQFTPGEQHRPRHGADHGLCEAAREFAAGDLGDQHEFVAFEPGEGVGRLRVRRQACPPVR
jgi:hypothetical protein